MTLRKPAKIVLRNQKEHSKRKNVSAVVTGVTKDEWCKS